MNKMEGGDADWVKALEHLIINVDYDLSNAWLLNYSFKQQFKATKDVWRCDNS